MQFVFRQKVFQNWFNNSEIVKVDNHASCDNLERIKSEICQSNKHGRDKMSTSESQHVVGILKRFLQKSNRKSNRTLR